MGAGFLVLVLSGKPRGLPASRGNSRVGVEKSGEGESGVHPRRSKLTRESEEGCVSHESPLEVGDHESRGTPM